MTTTLAYYAATGTAFLAFGSGTAVFLLTLVAWRQRRCWTLPWAISVAGSLVAVSFVGGAAIFLDAMLTRWLLTAGRLMAISVTFLLGTFGIVMFGWWVWHLPGRARP